MAENYFDNIRTAGAALDQGIEKLQETWEMPRLLLCNQNEGDQLAAKKLIENLRNELRLLKEVIEEDKVAIQSLRETQTEFLEESTKAIKSLKDDVDDIKILFAENGFIEEAGEDDLAIINSQLEALFVNDNSSLLKDSNDVTECENASMCVDDSSSKESFNGGSSSMNISHGFLQNKLLLDEQPMQPQYSPYHYKMIKKQ